MVVRFQYIQMRFMVLSYVTIEIDAIVPTTEHTKPTATPIYNNVLWKLVI